MVVRARRWADAAVMIVAMATVLLAVVMRALVLGVGVALSLERLRVAFIVKGVEGKRYFIILHRNS